jgi:hypothetical protein
LKTFLLLAPRSDQKNPLKSLQVVSLAVNDCSPAAIQKIQHETTKDRREFADMT